MKITEVQDILDEIIKQNCQECNVKEFVGKNLIEDLEMDSISLVNMIVDIEERFDILLALDGQFLGILDNYDKLLKHIYGLLEKGKE